MPTPVSVARQCLTEEAARALDDAVAVARRRSHAQTTSLHAVSALLSFPSSPLREACARTRSIAYSPRLQFKALELSVGVALDRLPCSKDLEEPPPVSNSLMAAIKRSQANQRRSPENFHLQHIHNSQSQQAPLLVKVELKHFLLSILDDPIVSRVLGEAGFRSYDIKLAIVHPPITHASRIFKSSCPPVFLCNLVDSEPERWGFSFPVDDGDENSRRIGEVLSRNSGRNPLLLGVYSAGALESFMDGVKCGKLGGVLPPALSCCGSISMDKEISLFVGDQLCEQKMDLKFREVRDALECSSVAGVIVSLGQLGPMVREDSSESAVAHVVSQVSGLVKTLGGKFWLIGASDNYETYLKFLSRFPTLEKDWDLHLLPITSKSSMDGFGSKSSLMGSFVPFGGFFSTPSDYVNPTSCSTFSISRCNLCDQKYSEEVADLLKVGSTSANSVADQCSAALPSWLQITELDMSNQEMQIPKAKDDGISLNAKILELQKKWNSICQRLHKCQSVQSSGVFRARSYVSAVEGSQVVADGNETASYDASTSESSAPPVSPCMATGPSKITCLGWKAAAGPVTSLIDTAYVQQDSKTQYDRMDNTQSSVKLLPQLAPSSSKSTITTDLDLGTIYISRNLGAQADSCDFKKLWETLKKKLGRQDEALCIISQVVCHYRSEDGNLLQGLSSRRGLWLAFLGPDRVGKKRVASALAEVVFNDKRRLVYVDLGSQERSDPSNLTFGCHEFEMNDLKFRGKTVVDYIASELRHKPHAVVYLDNIDKADPLTEDCLSRAIRTGKLKDTHGRELSTNNTIFVASSNASNDHKVVLTTECFDEYSEDRILGANRWQMWISVDCAGETAGKGSKAEATTTNKRKHGDVSGPVSRQGEKAIKSLLDLNLPVEEVEEDADDGCSETNSVAEASESAAWLREFFEQLDEKVEFKPFDLTEAAKKVVEEIRVTFRKVLGSDSTLLLEIDENVVVQIVGAIWLCEEPGAVDRWVQNVVRRGFVEVHQKHKLTSRSILKLTVREGVPAEEEASGVCLPARIHIELNNIRT